LISVLAILAGAARLLASPNLITFSRAASMLTSVVKNDQKKLLLLELGTLAVLSVLTLWSVRALLEEWGLFSAFNALGLGYIKQFAAEIPLRPLHLVPSAMYWEIAQGRTSGVAIGTLLLLVLRYLVVRWAVTPLFQGHDRWIVATLAAVLLAWPGAWLGRFAPAQFSALMFFLAFGFAIRVYRCWSLPAAIGCIVSIILLLCTYQALALCLVALPLFALLWKVRDQSAPRIGLMVENKAALRVAFTIALSFVLYGVYALLVSRGGGGGYEAQLAQSSGRLLTIEGLSTHIGGAYLTVFGGAPLLLPLLLVMAFYLQADRAGNDGAVQPPWRAPLVAAGLVAILPLFSLIYLNAGHITDPDRVMFPVSVAFVIVAASLLAWRHAAGQPDGGQLRAVVIVGALLLASTVMAYQVKKYANVQRQVITQAIAAIDAAQPRSLLIQDATGTLGDVYTLLNPTLTQALQVHKRQVDATICTLSSVDRIHPDAQRYPISTTARCEEVPAQPAPVLVLVARKENGVITLRP
jgi:hypothetical protein